MCFAMNASLLLPSLTPRVFRLPVWHNGRIEGNTEWLIPNFSDLDGDGCVDLLTAKWGPGGA